MISKYIEINLLIVEIYFLKTIFFWARYDTKAKNGIKINATIFLEKP